MPSHKLYYFPGSAAVAAHWTLVHLELQGALTFKTELVNLLTGAQKSAAYLSVNPKGLVPAIDIDGKITTESVAILLVLAERFPQLAPVTGSPNRDKYLETQVLITNKFVPALRDFLYAVPDLAGVQVNGKPAAENQEVVDAIKGLAAKRLDEVWEVMDKQLEGSDYLVGDRVTLVDFQLASIAQFHPQDFEGPASKKPNVRRWLARMKERDDFVELKKRETEQARALGL